MLKITNHSYKYELFTTEDGKEFTSKHDALQYELSLKCSDRSSTGTTLWIVRNLHRTAIPEVYSSLKLAELSLKCVPNKEWYEIVETSIDEKFVDDHINDNVVYPEVTISEGTIKFVDRY